MFMYNPRYIGIQTHTSILTRSRFICCTEGGSFIFILGLCARARDLSVDFRRVARDNVMRGEKFRFVIAQQKGNIKKKTFLPAGTRAHISGHGLVIISSHFRFAHTRVMVNIHECAWQHYAYDSNALSWNCHHLLRPVSWRFPKLGINIKLLNSNSNIKNKNINIK